MDLNKGRVNIANVVRESVPKMRGYSTECSWWSDEQMV